MAEGDRSVVFGMVVDLARLRTGLDQSVGLVRGTVGRIERAFGALANPFAALGLAAAGTGLALMVRNAFELADSLDEMASRTGVGVVALQELQHAARLTGAGVEGLENGLRFLNKNLSEAAIGKKEAAELFAELGIAVKDANGNIRNATDVLGDVADKMAALENPAERVRVAVTLFGRAGTALIPMLERGREGLAEFAAGAHRLGLVLDESMVEQAGKAKDELDALAAAIKVNATRAVLQFTPEILELAASFNDLLVGLKNVAEFFGKDQFVGVTELTARLSEARTEAARLQAVMADVAAGRHFIQNPSAPGGRLEVEARLKASAARVADLEALLAKREAAARPGAATGRKSGLSELADAEAVKKFETRLEAMRQQLLTLAIPDPVLQSIVKTRVETAQLVEEFTKLGNTKAADAARAFGLGLDEALQKQLALKTAITDTQAAQVGKSLGLGDTNLFAGFAEIDTIKTEANKFGEAIQGLLKRGVPLKDVFDLIGQSQDALSLKTANLREKFAEQPIVLEQIRNELAGIDFGGFQREQDALARSTAGVSQGFVGVGTTLGQVGTEFDLAALAAIDLSTVLSTDVPVGAQVANAALAGNAQWVDYLTGRWQAFNRELALSLELQRALGS
jgi:hypothetical protein